MIPFLIWDVIFTQIGVWGFNPAYHGNIVILGLPLEEILFFIIVPYACIFTYYVFKFHFPKYKLSIRATKVFTYLSMLFTIVFAILFRQGVYTLVNLLFFAFVIYVSFRINPETLSRFLLIYPVLVVPFVIVNGILTGTGIEKEIVWYKSNEIIGWRMGTIPFEDFFYAFSLILFNLLLMELLENYFKRKKVI
jgi:lycopene cyclase domain-containing protein